MSRRPDLFIIGAPKAGTSSLYDYLSGHPDIYMSPVKEPYYFAPDVKRHRGQLRYPDDADKYLELFAGSKNEKHAGEASTGYIRSEVAPRLIQEFQPDAWLIAMLRNPVDLLHAIHNERISSGLEDETDFEAALALDDARMAGEHVPADSNSVMATYKDKARYAPQLERWIDAFGRERLHIVVLEEFAADPAPQFQRVLEFLEVDPTYEPEDYSVKNRSNLQRRGLVKQLAGSRPVRWTRRKLMPAILGAERSARASRQVKHSRLMRKPNPRPPVDERLRRSLEKEYRDDVIAVSTLVGRDLEALWFGREQAQSVNVSGRTAGAAS